MSILKAVIISMLLCAAMISAAGCAASDSESEPAATETVTTTAAQSTEAATAGSAAVTATSKITTTEITTTELVTETTSETVTITEASSVTTAAPTTTKKLTAAKTATAKKKAPVSDPTVSSSDEMARLIKAHKYNSAVLVYSMDGEVLYSYQPNTLISGASLIKLPYVYYCCTQLSNGVHSLSDTVTYTESWYHGGSGVIRRGAYGKKYTVAQLIDYTLRYSDNVAYDMLVYLFGTDGYNKMVDSWGYNVHISKYTRFPAVSASFMKTSMQKMQAKSTAGESWKIAWTALNESTNNYSRKAIGGKNKIAIKYGNIASQWHEVCYVSGDTPYILVILSGANGYGADVSFVTGVAKTADKMVKEHYAAKTTTTVTTTSPTTTTTTAKTSVPPTVTSVTTTTTQTEPVTVTTAPPETTPEETASSDSTVTTSSEQTETTAKTENENSTESTE